MTHAVLADGYSEVPPGKLASVVTCLEMRSKPVMRAERADGGWRLRRVDSPEVDWYRKLFQRMGAEWLWFSRLAMATTELTAILCNPDVEIYTLAADGLDQGLLELDFREPDTCELAFFGVSKTLQGSGAGRWLMNRALERAWGRSIKRLWVHTCTLDHPSALAFYQRSGFSAYARLVEVVDDPRLTGVLPVTVAAGLPLIDR